ncbi:MAG: hypothetical protein AB7N99_00090 [Simkaniaceae bacterium]
MATRAVGQKSESSLWNETQFSDEETSWDLDEEVVLPEEGFSQMKDLEHQFGMLGFQAKFDPFKTPPQSPEKPKDPFQTPSPFKAGEAALDGLKVTPSKVSPTTANTLVKGYRSTRNSPHLDPEKASNLQKRFMEKMEGALKKGESSDSPQGHRHALEYAAKLEWVETLLHEFHRSPGKGILLFDIEHIVSGEREENEGVGKLSGKHFFTLVEFQTMVQSSVTSTLGVRVVTWIAKAGDTPKRSSIFPDPVSPEDLISRFNGVPAQYRSGNRSLRILEGLCVEIYHQAFKLRSAFPPFYFMRLEAGKSYTLMEGKTFTAVEILTFVKEMNARVGLPHKGPNPMSFFNKMTEMCVVEVATKVGIQGVDTGVYFEIPKELLVPTYVSEEHFEDLIEDI